MTRLFVKKFALPFLPLAPDSNRNKSIISYDISESEAGKSKTIDSLLPKKVIPKKDTVIAAEPQQTKDSVPTGAPKKTKEKKKAKSEIVEHETTQTTYLTPPAAQPQQVVSIVSDSLQHTAIKIIAPVKVAIPKVQKNYSESLFRSNLIQAHSINPKIKNRENNDWVTSVLLFIVAIICIINVSYRNRLRQLFNAFVSNRFVGQMVREENVVFQRLSLFLSLLFLFVTSLFVFQAGRFYKVPFASNSSFINYSVILILLFLFYFLKIVAYNFLGFLLKLEKEIREYIFSVLLYNHIVGLGLIPLVIVLAFVPHIAHQGVFILGGCFFAAAFALRTLRGWANVAGNGRFSMLYIFLYLCTLEILPLVVITKLLVSVV